MVLARSWKIKKVVTGTPTPSHYEMFKEELGALKVGEIITKTLFITVDPYLRGVMNSLPVGSPIPSQQVAKVIESKDVDFPVGTLLLSRNGWCDYAKLNPKAVLASPLGFRGIEKAPDIGELSPSLLVGACGMPGVTAYWGLLDLCKVIPDKYKRRSFICTTIT
jgi:prostaglandin reductase 1